MELHSWWQGYGSAAEVSDLPPRARSVAEALVRGLSGATLKEVRQALDGTIFALRVDCEVERPQLLEYDIKGLESIAILFGADESIQPSILALRSDFPDTPHQNEKPENFPCVLCADDRPWPEIQLTWTPLDLIRRIQIWLAKAARGELHESGRPLDPIFFRAQRTIILPRVAVSNQQENLELAGFVHDDQRVIVTKPIAELERIPEQGRLVVVVYRVKEQEMSRLRHAPVTLSGLAKEMKVREVDLIKDLQERTVHWSGLAGDDLRRLSSRLAIVVAFPIGQAGGEAVDDVRVFVAENSIGEIGVALGTLWPNTSGKGSKAGYVRAVPASPANIEGITIEPTEVQFEFDRELAASAAGVAPDKRRAVLVGAGALGSQLALNLTREGAFLWSIVDNDHLMPHNLARHGLSAADVGLAKATALARELGHLLGEPATAIIADIIAPPANERQNLEEALSSADIIIDASASVAAARHISDLPGVKARRISAFFNPAGTALILLTEPVDRSVTLRDLEAQYHRLVLTVPDLKGHLRTEQKGLRYSGSCRSLSNRIPATRAALLSALAAGGIKEALAEDAGSIRIWRMADNGDIRHLQVSAQITIRVQVGDWTLCYDQGVLDQLAEMREARLPNETGGVLLGIVDMSRKSLHVVSGLPQPPDSVGSVTGFERGVAGLAESVNEAIESSLHQLRYVGEWHSHPVHSSALPSSTDLRQLAWLRHEIQAEGLPALIAIAADDGRFSFVIAPIDNPAVEAETGLEPRKRAGEAT